MIYLLTYILTKRFFANAPNDNPQKMCHSEGIVPEESFELTGLNYFIYYRSVPIKNNATVPGPECAPITGSTY